MYVHCDAINRVWQMLHKDILLIMSFLKWTLHNGNQGIYMIPCKGFYWLYPVSNDNNDLNNIIVSQTVNIMYAKVSACMGVSIYIYLVIHSLN